MMWKEKYKIGVELIDNQHKELFNRVYTFIKVIQSDEDWNEKANKVKETLEFMRNYVETHFDDEEKYQESINYPEIEEHKKAHKEFKEGIYKYIERFKSEGYTQELVQEFGGKLMTWLILHVTKTDQKIGDYVKKQKKEGEL